MDIYICTYIMHINRTSLGWTQAKHRSQAPSAAVCLTSKHHGDFQICPDRLPRNVMEVTINIINGIGFKSILSKNHQKPSKTIKNPSKTIKNHCCFKPRQLEGSSGFSLKHPETRSGKHFPKLFKCWIQLAAPHLRRPTILVRFASPCREVPLVQPPWDW